MTANVEWGLFHWFMVGVGGFAGICGLLIGFMRLRTLISGKLVRGRVVEIAEGATVRTGTKVRPMLAPVVEFDHEGRAFRFRSSVGMESTLPVGSEVPVRFLVSDPQSSAEIDTAKAFWTFPLGALVFAALFIGVAFYDAGYFAR